MRWRRDRQKTWGAALLLLGMATRRTIDELLAAPCPSRWPQSLDGITYAGLVALQQAAAKGYAALAEAACRVLLDIGPAEVAALPAYDVAGLANMVLRELERIGKLFETCKVEPSDIEKRANPPAGDWFAMVDWYARRMGYTDHNAAAEVRWEYYLRCATIDAEQNRYERRRAALQLEEMKRKQKKR